MQLALWQQNQVFQASARYFSNPNQVICVPKPNHAISTALLQHRTFNLKKRKIATLRNVKLYYICGLQKCTLPTSIPVIGLLL